MRFHPRANITLIALFLLAGVFSRALTGQADARSSLFQSELFQSPLMTPVAPPPPSPTAPLLPLPTEIVPLPTEIAPLPTVALPTPILVPTETPTSLLPPPTLTLRETATPVLLQPTYSALETPLAVRTARAPTPTVPPPPGLSLANFEPLLDTGLTAFGYIWLACGVTLFAGAGVAFFWLWRRRPPGA